MELTHEITLGTIRHNTDDRRVDVWIGTDGRIWADRDDPHVAHESRPGGYKHALHICKANWHGVWDWQPQTRVIYQAKCDQFDDSASGYHASEEEAEAAFWALNTWTDSERRRVQVYIVEGYADDPEIIEHAAFLATRGVPSPALGVAATA